MDRVETGLISHIGRIRGADPKQVSALAESIKEVGLLNPISVYRTSIVRNGKTVDGYGLIAGFHRLRACQSLGWGDIPAVILDLDEQRRIIAECDENLCGSVLTPAERATFTAKRKDAYETLHPETRHGIAGAAAKHGAVANLATASFADDQAAKTGQSARSVRRDAERGQLVCQEALDILKGTKADTGTVLDRIKDLTTDQQVNAARDEVNRRATQKKGNPREPKVADAPESDEAALERQVHALMAAWNKAAPDARREFLSRIDSAVMDKGGWQ